MGGGDGRGGGRIVLRMPGLKKSDAFSQWAGDTPLLAISDGRSGDQLRMTCAHELWHLVMHSKKLAFKVDEGEADEFASEFLMPAKAMKRELRPPITLSQLAKLKPRWKVPIQALILRARHVRILTERQQEYLIAQLALQGWTDNEPVQLRPEKPRGLRQLAEMFYGIPIDYDSLATDTSLTPRIVREILECYAPKKSRARPD
jgi:Zn-dependent peptidase ImmA (M78 family)